MSLWCVCHHLYLPRFASPRLSPYEPGRSPMASPFVDGNSWEDVRVPNRVSVGFVDRSEGGTCPPDPSACATCRTQTGVSPPWFPPRAGEGGPPGATWQETGRGRGCAAPPRPGSGPLPPFAEAHREERRFRGTPEERHGCDPYHMVFPMACCRMDGGVRHHNRPENEGGGERRKEGPGDGCLACRTLGCAGESNHGEKGCTPDLAIPPCMCDLESERKMEQLCVFAKACVLKNEAHRTR
eukprot:scaffold113_cov339-Pavlova_lutheri.AAC.36